MSALRWKPRRCRLPCVLACALGRPLRGPWTHGPRNRSPETPTASEGACG